MFKELSFSTRYRYWTFLISGKKAAFRIESQKEVRADKRRKTYNNATVLWVNAKAFFFDQYLWPK